MSQTTFTNPLTNRVLPIKTNGKTSKTLLKLLKQGRTDLLTETPYLWNPDTQRLTERSVYYRQTGQPRSATLRLYNIIDNALYKKAFPSNEYVKYTYPTDNIRTDGILYDLVYNRLNLTTQSVRIITRIGEDVESKTYDLYPVVSTSAEREKVRVQKYYAKSSSGFQIQPNTNVALFWDSMYSSTQPKDFDEITIIFHTKSLPNKSLDEIIQYYLDGENVHCVLDPIIDRFTLKHDEVTSRSSKQEYKQKIRKLNEYKDVFNKGCSEDDLRKICDDLRLTIHIRSLVCSHSISIVSNNSRHEFRYVNNRMNHIEPDTYYHVNQTPEIVSDIRPYIKDNHLLIGNRTIPRLVIEPNGQSYKQEDPFSDVFNDFLEKNKIRQMAMCVRATDDIRSINAFISRCQSFTTHLTFKTVRPNKYEIQKQDDYMYRLNDKSDLVEVDSEKAYTQYKHCRYYEKFPTVFTQYGRFLVPVSNPHTLRIGYYAIENISFDIANSRAKYILEKANFCNGVYALPLLKAFYDVGVRFDIIGGCWCHTTCEFDLSEYMEKYNDVPAYSLITGRMANVSKNTRMYIKCTEEDAILYQAQLSITERETTCNYYNVEGICEITRPKQFYQHYAHIAGYITGYCFLNVFDEMLRLPSEALVMLKLDSIIYDSSLAPDYKPSPLFRRKNTKLIKTPYDALWSSWDTLYTPYLTNEIADPKAFPNRVNLWNGAGGTGKTHTVLTDKSFYNNTLYVSKAWVLGVDKHNEYKTKIVSMDKLLGCKTEPYDTIKWGSPSVIVCDEATQYNKGIASDVLTKYPYSIIIFIGDIDPVKNVYYQCDFDFGVESPQMIDMDFVKKHNVAIRTFTKSYRVSEGDVLLPKLEGLRNLMAENVPLKMLKDYVSEQFTNHIDYTQLYTVYEDGDYAIVSTREQAQIITNAMKTKLKNRWICEKHSPQDLTNALKGLSVDLHGTIKVQDECPSSNYKLSHAFTIHSFQGKTIPYPHKIFIDMNRIFNYQQLYTALSRGQKYEQIVLLV